MGLNPSYDDLSVFFTSYVELSALCDAKASSYYVGSSSGSSAFLPRLSHTLAVIVALVVHDHLPTYGDLEFMGMDDGDKDLIFDALCTDSDSNLSPPKISVEEPPSDRENEDPLGCCGPTGDTGIVWGATHGRRWRVRRT